MPVTIPRSLAACLTMITVAACTNLQQFQAMPAGTHATEFTRTLAQHYRRFATDLWNTRADFSAAEWFAAKGMRVNDGEAVPPEELEVWQPWPGVAAELAEMRARLVRSFERGSRLRRPADAAAAQRAFDCWLVRASTITAGGMPWPPSAPAAHFLQMVGQRANASQMHAQSCKEEFFSSLSHIEPVEDGGFQFLIRFDPGRWNLDADGRATVREAAALIHARGSVDVIVNGFADTVGASGPNQILSQRRANAVRRALTAAGVQATTTAVGFGETRPLAETPDNTPEWRNRMVTISLRYPAHPRGRDGHR